MGGYPGIVVGALATAGNHHLGDRHGWGRSDQSGLHPSLIPVYLLISRKRFGPRGADPIRTAFRYCRAGGVKPSVKVCMKLTSASSSASERPRCPTRAVFMLAVDSGAGQ